MITVIIAMTNLQCVVRREICCLVLLFFAPLALVSKAYQCPPLNSSTSPSKEAMSLQQVPGGLSPLIAVASSIRESLLGENLDYDLLVADINRIYSGQVEFSESTFLQTSFTYCISVIPTAVVTLVLAIFLPVVGFWLWFLWRWCCGEDSGSEEEEEEDWLCSAQFLACAMSMGVCLCLCCVVAFVVVLLLGEWQMNTAVEDSGQLISQTLPMVADIHANALATANETLLDDFAALEKEIYCETINQSLSAMIASVSQSNTASVDYLLHNVLLELSTAGQAADLISNVLSWQLTVQGTEFLADLSLLVHNMTELVGECELLVAGGNVTGDLLGNCSLLLANSSAYLPYPSSLVQSNFTSLPNTSQLAELNQQLDHILELNLPSLVQGSRDGYQAFLLSLERNISKVVTTNSALFLGNISSNLSKLAHDIHSLYGSFTYGLPEAQQKVDLYVGQGYLTNWREFCQVVTIAFSLSLFVLVMGVVLAMGRGLTSLWAAYIYGDGQSYYRNVHKASIMLRKLAVWLSVAAIVAAFFFIFMLCVASLVARSCAGESHNFTDLIDHVIDNTSSWGGIYPLASTYLGQPTAVEALFSVPVTVNQMLQECGQSGSAVEALQLDMVLDIDECLSVPESLVEDYILSLKSFSSSSYYVLSQELESALYQYQSVANTMYPWFVYENLSSSSLFEESFQGVDGMVQLIDNLKLSTAHQQQVANGTLLSNITDVLSDVGVSLGPVQEFATWFSLSLPEIGADSSQLNVLLMASASSIAMLLKSAEETGKDVVFSVDNLTLSEAAPAVIEQVEKFVSSTQEILQCAAADCYPVAQDTANFTVVTCHNFLNGLDVFWVSLASLALCLIASVLLTLVMAAKFANTNNEMPQRSKHTTFVLYDHIITQINGTGWLVLALLVNTWLMIAIADDELLDEDCSGMSWCFKFVWIHVFGAVFLVLSAILTLSLRAYQWVMIHRIRVYAGCKGAMVQRYWLKRIRVIKFYTQLSMFFLLDVPFLGIAGAYTSERGILVGVAFLSLLISLLGISYFLMVLLADRNHLVEYLTWLQHELTTNCCQCLPKFEASPQPPSAAAGGSNHAGSANGMRINGRVATLLQHNHSQHSLSEDEDHMELQLQTIPPSSLPVVEEQQMQSSLSLPDGRAGPVEANITLEPATRNGPDEEREETRMMPPPPAAGAATAVAIVNGQAAEWGKTGPHTPNKEQPAGITLDRDISDLENEDVVFRRRQREQMKYQEAAGVEVTRQCDSQGDTSTPRSSYYFGSQDSVMGSDSRIGGPFLRNYASTDESSTKDDYDSYDSDYPYHQSYLPDVQGGISMEV